jgi:nucleotide-binding universal stress UspA family protein
MNVKKLLLPVGGTDTDRFDGLVETVANLAEPGETTVGLLHVFDRKAYDEYRERLHARPDSEVTPATVAGRRESVRTLRSGLEERGFEVEVLGALGDRGDAIVREAEDWGADLLVVGGRKRSPTGKAVFGSVAQEVMMNAPCPVTFVRDETTTDEDTETTRRAATPSR